MGEGPGYQCSPPSLRGQRLKWCPGAKLPPLPHTHTQRHSLAVGEIEWMEEEEVGEEELDAVSVGRLQVDATLQASRVRLGKVGTDQGTVHGQPLPGLLPGPRLHHLVTAENLTSKETTIC